MAGLARSRRLLDVELRRERREPVHHVERRVHAELVVVRRCGDGNARQRLLDLADSRANGGEVFLFHLVAPVHVGVVLHANLLCAFVELFETRNRPLAPLRHVNLIRGLGIRPVSEIEPTRAPFLLQLPDGVQAIGIARVIEAVVGDEVVGEERHPLALVLAPDVDRGERIRPQRRRVCDGFRRFMLRIRGRTECDGERQRGRAAEREVVHAHREGNAHRLRILRRDEQRTAIDARALTVWTVHANPEALDVLILDVHSVKKAENRIRPPADNGLVLVAPDLVRRRAGCLHVPGHVALHVRGGEDAALALQVAIHAHLHVRQVFCRRRDE